MSDNGKIPFQHNGKVKRDIINQKFYNPRPAIPGGEPAGLYWHYYKCPPSPGKIVNMKG